MASPENENICQTCLYRTVGCGKCSMGFICFPIFTCISLCLGIGKTIVGCVTCDCSETFFKEREQLCRCYGVGTAMSLSTEMILTGVGEMCTKPVHISQGKVNHVEANNGDKNENNGNNGNNGNNKNNI
jgi:hypothetical protein